MWRLKYILIFANLCKNGKNYNNKAKYEFINDTVTI